MNYSQAVKFKQENPNAIVYRELENTIITIEIDFNGMDVIKEKSPYHLIKRFPTSYDTKATWLVK